MPFTDLYSLLKRGQGQIGGLGGAGGAVLASGAPYRTPTFVPQQSDPALGGGDPGVDPQGSAPQAGFTGLLRSPQFQAFGASLLANSGYQPGKGVTGGQALGEALMAGQQAKRQSLNDQLQQELLRAQISKTQRDAASGGQDPALVAEYNAAKQEGYTGSLVDFIKLKQGTPQQPSAIQEAEYFRNLSPEQQRQYLEVKRAQSTPFLQTDQGGATGAFDRRTGAFTPQVTPEDNAAAAARAAAEKAAAEAAAKVQTERDSTFQQDLAVIDDEILRAQRLKTEFESGKYRTGPIAGRLPSVTDAGQNLDREQSRDVLKNISQATFGALSEGERAFLKGIGIDPLKNEGSNISYLEEKLATLQKAKQRLISRPPVQDQRQRGGATASFAAPSDRPPLSSFRRP